MLAEKKKEVLLSKETDLQGEGGKKKLPPCRTLVNGTGQKRWIEDQKSLLLDWGRRGQEKKKKKATLAKKTKKNKLNL